MASNGYQALTIDTPSSSPSSSLSRFQSLRKAFRDYYTADDLLPLSRQRHREQIIYYRKTCTSMGITIFLLALLALRGNLRTCNAQPVDGCPVTSPAVNSSRTSNSSTIWQPDDFDWESKRALSGPKETWKGLYVNMTANRHAKSFLTADKAYFPPTANTTDLIAIDGPRENIIPVAVAAWFAGISWATVSEVAGLGVTVASTVSAIQGCVTDDGSPWGNFNCITGLLGTAVAFGQAVKLAKGLGWFARSSATWLNSGLESIELSVFSKRGELHPERYQIAHEWLISSVLNQTFGSSEFIGHASDNHRLGARHDEHLHPRAPIFRVRHPRHGMMDIASREHVNGTRFTITYANGMEKRGLGHLDRRQTYQHEALNGAVMEARFDTEAAEADPCNPTFDAAASFGQLEDTISCFTQGKWPDGKIMKAQLYDSSCEATMGFVHMGFFQNDAKAEVLGKLKPSGMPLPECS